MHQLNIADTPIFDTNSKPTDGGVHRRGAECSDHRIHRDVAIFAFKQRDTFKSIFSLKLINEKQLKENNMYYKNEQINRTPQV